MKKNSVIRAAISSICILTIFVVITTHGTLTASRAILGVVAIIFCPAIVLCLDKFVDSGKDINRFFDLKIKSYPLLEIVFFAFLTILAIYARIKFLPMRTEDTDAFFVLWVEQFRNLGVKTSLGAVIGDYSPLYTTILIFFSLTSLPALTVVKLFPIVCDFGIAVVFLLLYKELSKKNAFSVPGILLYACTLFNPISMLNSAAWGQCDSTYAFFIVLSLYFLCKISNGESKATDVAVVMFAIAFSLKFQAVLSIPFLMFYWFAQDKTSKEHTVKLSQFIWFPILYFISAIPMFLCGKPIIKIVSVYANQTGEYLGNLNMRYYNFYSLIGSTVSESTLEGYSSYGIVVTLSVLTSLYAYIYRREVKIIGITIMKLASLTVLIMTYFLPSMHERYAYVAEIILILVTFVDTSYTAVAVTSIVATTLAYADYLATGDSTYLANLSWAIAIVRLIIIAYIVRDVVGKRTYNPC